jgi:hypothetical protein
LNPTKTSPAEIRPHQSGYIRPVIFGHQKCNPPWKAMIAPPTMM